MVNGDTALCHTELILLIVGDFAAPSMLGDYLTVLVASCVYFLLCLRIRASFPFRSSLPI